MIVPATADISLTHASKEVYEQAGAFLVPDKADFWNELTIASIENFK